MSATPSPEVHWLCPSCDAEPAVPPADGLCPSCASRLIEVRARSEDLTGVVVDGRFEIRGLLGQGGMGAVYRAWQRSVGRDVAIKLIDERHGRDPMAVRRFLREARLASQLSQPNTVSVLDFGQSSDGRLFIAMELVRGRTLAEVLAEEGPFPPARAAWIGVQLCDALDAAHRLQIVHRDLKPANVVLLDDPPGRDLIKVLDFGLAKSLAESETKATDTGLVVGTPRYMAPEVILGERPTAQSDLYAVGVILGELATGKLMWDATSFPALAGQKLQGSPIIHELPLGLRGVVSRLIDPDVHRRPSSASDARALLRPVVGDGAPTSAPMPAEVPPDLDERSDPSGRRSSTAPPVDPTLPQLGTSTAPATPAARRSAATAAAPTPGPASAVELARRAAERDVAATPSGERAGVSSTGALGRRALLLGGGALLVAAVVAALVMARGSDDRGRQTASRASGAGATPRSDGAVVAAADAPSIDVAPVEAPPVEVASAVAGGAVAPATVQLQIRSRPSGADVTVDGRPAGRTPTAVTVPRGADAVVVQVRSGGLAGRQRVTPDQDRTLNFRLRARREDLPF